MWSGETEENTQARHIVSHHTIFTNKNAHSREGTWIRKVWVEEFHYERTEIAPTGCTSRIPPDVKTDVNWRRIQGEGNGERAMGNIPESASYQGETIKY